MLFGYSFKPPMNEKRLGARTEGLRRPLWRPLRSVVSCACLLLVKFSESSFAAGPSQPSSASTIASLRQQAQAFLDQSDPDAAFSVLSDIYNLDPHTQGLNRLFESALHLRIRVADDDQNANAQIQDRFGLASLLLDQERYEEAIPYLVDITQKLDPGNERASCLLFRANAACCRWNDYTRDSEALHQSLRLKERIDTSNSFNDVPSVHPFEALKWPCISLSEATQIAVLYARRAIGSVSDSLIQNKERKALLEIENVESFNAPPVVTVSLDNSGDLPFTRNNSNRTQKTRIRLGYISPDFTSKHPLAFLMQDVFRHHNRDDFTVHLYSLASPETSDSSPELTNIRNGSDSFTYLPVGGTSPEELAKRIEEDNLDILIDLCGHTGTMVMAQILALRPAPVQVSYMGFPGSSGAAYHDYLVCDARVVPPHLRCAYTESMIWMPHCYFVNSHAAAADASCTNSMTDGEVQQLRHVYGLPVDGFVFCCHSRPYKIDPVIFRTWLRALRRTREKNGAAVLWLLRSGEEMERNLRRIALDEFDLDEGALVFCDICPRDEHLQRLHAADLFLDTPAYNAHTLGCDTLFAGVPMITLLVQQRSDEPGRDSVLLTDKLASRVGASLLLAAGLDEMICSDLDTYESQMVACATEKRDWFQGEIRQRLRDNILTCTLFDTKRWVKNLEVAFRYVALHSEDESPRADIRIADHEL